MHCTIIPTFLCLIHTALPAAPLSNQRRIALTSSLPPSTRSGYTQQCVCTQHNELSIYQRPSTHSITIGNMYLGDCKLYYDQQYHSTAFLPVLHYHQVGYVINDSRTAVTPCPDFKTEPWDKLTTTQAPPTRCNKLALFTNIAYKKNVGLLTSLQCPGYVNHDADAAVMAFCSAPDPSLWIRGIKVTENCNRLAKYIPVAVFDHQSTYQQSAGILLACNQQSIHCEGMESFLEMFRMLTIVRTTDWNSQTLVNVWNTSAYYPLLHTEE